MHLSIKDQTDSGKPAIMCIEKSIRTCIILSATPAEASTFATLAEAMGVHEVYCLARVPDLERLEEDGWLIADNAVVLSKKMGGKK